MKKDTLLNIILGTVGGLIFSVGMCMCLVKEWNMFTPGVIVAIIGLAVGQFVEHEPHLFHA